jgi:predicted dienelactone hydrolase
MLAALACVAQEGPEMEQDLVAALVAPGPYAVIEGETELTYADLRGTAERTLRVVTWTPADGGNASAVVFSHGHQGFASNSSFLMEHLASHGWWVAAPDHTGNTFADGADRTTEIYFQRPLDITAVVSALPDLFGGEPATTVAIGHSFGGYTVLALAAASYVPVACDGVDSSFCSTMTDDYAALFAQGFYDNRIDAVIAMAAGDWDLFQDGLLDTRMPILHMSASEDSDPAEEIWASLQGRDGNRRLVLEGGGHQSFTDFADTMQDVPLSGQDGWDIVDAYALAWVMAANGDETGRPLLDGEVTVSKAGTLVR